MKSVTITIRTENAAFEDAPGPDPGPEVSRILRQLARKLQERPFYDLSGEKLFDVNGNHVGEVKVE